MHQKKFVVSILIIVSVFALQSFNVKKDKVRNLQVLPKDITDDDLDKIMDTYCESLNVKCNFCHVKGDMASDEKEDKKITRKMMVMANEINEKYFGKDSGTVGCMTCHNGKKNPSDMK